jgi:hypothetical protein
MTELRRNILTDWTTDPVHGFWVNDPLWTPPADGDPVSSWRNGGTAGGEATSSGSSRPTYRAEVASLVVGAIGLYGVTIPPGTNFTEISENNANRALQSEYDLTNATTTVSWNLGASTLCCMAAIEVTDE